LAFRSGVGRRFRLAVSAEPEQLEPMGFDPVPTPPCDLAHSLGHPTVLDVGGAPAARADDMVVVGGRARDVCVLTARQIEPFNDAQVGQQVQGTEERRPTDTQAPRPGDLLELGCGEMTIVLGDQGRHGSPWAREPIPCDIKGPDDRVRFHHAG